MVPCTTGTIKKWYSLKKSTFFKKKKWFLLKTEPVKNGTREMYQQKSI